MVIPLIPLLLAMNVMAFKMGVILSLTEEVSVGKLVENSFASTNDVNSAYSLLVSLKSRGEIFY